MTLRSSDSIVVVCLAVIVIGLSSCAPPPPAPPEGAPPPYSKMRERLAGLDTTPLQGMRIVIDPGHGGRFDGAVGPTGLREADVNLGVALSLWGLLRDAGADVTLTRSSDRTVAEGREVTLRDDLEARAAIANEAAAQIFVSIHHNSDVGGEPTVNRIETYYKASDQGPSYDAARALHDHLSFNIDEMQGGVIAGNYLVLRECEAPALLGEPSFISNPYVEARLKEADVQKMEAEAYFLGLLDYFSRGVPALRRVAPAEGVVEEPYPVISVLAEPGRGGIGIDAASLCLVLDGRSEKAVYDPIGRLITCTPEEPLAGGRHVVSVRVRNLAGNWSPALGFTFDVKTIPASVFLEPEDGIGAVNGVPFAVEARVYDVHMNPVADGTPVAFETDAAVYPDTAYTTGGVAICYLVPPSGGSFKLEAHCGAATMGFAVDAARALRGGSPLWAFLRDAQDGTPIADAVVSLDGRPLAKSNRDGFVKIDTMDREEGLWRIEASGYAWRADSTFETTTAPFDSLSNWPVNSLELQRAAGGLMYGRVFAIDPEGGGNDRAGQGPTGMDASWVNFEVAAALARLIEEAGGVAVVTRDRDRPASDLQRLLAAEDAGAFRYIVISHRPCGPRGTPVIEYYPGSTAGRSLSDALAGAAVDMLGAQQPEIRESSRYALRQTSCPAIYADLLPLTDRKTEKLLSQPCSASKEAYAIYAAILEHLDGGATLTADGPTVKLALPRGSGPAKAATVTLDGYLKLLADQDGALRLAELEPGEHTLDVSLSGNRTAVRKFLTPAEGAARTITIELEAD
jgi:N-acetylmuramoyl-L-alanine amidase